MWTAFIIAVILGIGMLLFNVYSLYSKYYAVQDEMNRCASVAIDTNVMNSKLRDTITDMDSSAALAVLDSNIAQAGWTRESNGWVKYSGGKLYGRLSDVRTSVSGSTLHMNAQVNIPLPWSVDGTSSAQFPLDVYSKILYIDVTGG